MFWTIIVMTLIAEPIRAPASAEISAVYSIAVPRFCRLTF